MLNVAFENPRAIASAKREREERLRIATRRKLKGKEKAADIEVEVDAMSPYDVPDRVTGRETLAELRKIHPDREWRFVEVDVTYQVYAGFSDGAQPADTVWLGMSSCAAKRSRFDVSFRHR